MIAILLSLFLMPAWADTGPEITPQDSRQDEASAVRDRLMTSLFFRGELADKIIEAGMAGRFADLDGIETNAGVRSALLAWIEKNPAEAAAVYLGMKGAGGQLHGRIEIRETAWEFKPAFIAAIKALNDAAGSASVSRETLELAARRLYEGKQAEAEGPEVRVGGAAGGSGFFSINYADYRLNKAGLEREISRAGAWLEAARGGGPGRESEGAFSLYSEFIVAASALKGRQAITEQESRRLEGLRAKLRSAMAALALRSRISALSDAGVSLGKNGAEPGAKALLASVTALRSRLEAAAAAVEAGGATLRELGGLVNSAENDFAALYLRYSAYDGLLGLKGRAARSGFSCFYDYAVYRYLSAFFPGTAYPRARAELAAAAGALDAALLKAGAGDLPGALSGLETAPVEAAAAVVRSSSAFNRGAQFFLWGLLFRPVENKISVRGGRAAYRPAFTFYEVAGRK
ncbi:MAG: hypothetical protein Q7R35_14360 [Elusimicrobiota bacterium]|nr:hypothetical protein [Elusimicrobiota bacterium]